MVLKIAQRANALAADGRLSKNDVQELIKTALDGEGVTRAEAKALHEVRADFDDKFTDAAARDFDRFLDRMDDSWNAGAERFLYLVDPDKVKALLREDPRIGIMTGRAADDGPGDRFVAADMVAHRMDRIWRSQPAPAGVINAAKQGRHPFANVAIDQSSLDVSSDDSKVTVSVEAQANWLFKGATENKVRQLAEQFLAPHLATARDELDHAGMQRFELVLDLNVIPPEPLD